MSRRVLYPTWQLLNLILGGYQAKLATTAKNVISNKERENVHSTTPPIYRFLQLHYNIAMLECLIWRACSIFMLVSEKMVWKWRRRWRVALLRVGALELFWALYRTAWGQDLWDSSAISKIAREERDSGRMMGVKTCGHLLWKVRVVGVTYKKGFRPEIPFPVPDNKIVSFESSGGWKFHVKRCQDVGNWRRTLF